MARFLKQSTSVDVPIGCFVDETDGKTVEGSLTITQPDIRLKKNNGNWAQKAAAQTLSHEENGQYEVTLDATDTNTLGLLRLQVNEAGACPVTEDFMVITANAYDFFFGAGIPSVGLSSSERNAISDADSARTLGTESYATLAAVPTKAQALFMILSLLSEQSISGTVQTSKKLDGATTAMTHTLNSATDPTSKTRAT